MLSNFQEYYECGFFVEKLVTIYERVEVTFHRH